MIEHEDELPDFIEELNELLPKYTWIDTDKYEYEFISYLGVPKCISITINRDYCCQINNSGSYINQSFNIQWDNIQTKLTKISNNQNSILGYWKFNNQLYWEKEILRRI